MLRWTVRLKGGPRRNRHAAVAVGHRVYSFGGYCDGESSIDMDQIEVHVFNTVSLRWAKLPPVRPGRGGGGGGKPLTSVPSMRWGHTAVLIDDVIYLWGGCTYRWEYCKVLYAFDVDAGRWFKPRISGTVPEARRSHSACGAAGVMYIYGGYNRNRQQSGCCNDVHMLDTATMAWALVDTRGYPAPVSCGHSATIMDANMFVFGGIGNDTDGDRHYYNNNVRVFATETKWWLSSTPSAARLLPEGRFCHAAFAYNGELYIFGGHNLDRKFDDTWKFNPETCSWKKVEPKGRGPCGMSKMGCCTVGDCIVLFGRYTPHDLYILDLSPSLKMLCKLAVIQHGLEQSRVPHDIKWELAAMS